MKFLALALAAASYIANSDGTVADRQSGLLWQQTDGGEMTWESARDYCGALTLGGKSGWRLPSNQELFRIMEHANRKPAIDSVFTRTEAEYWWSVDTRADDASRVWSVNAGGGTGPHPKRETISAGGSKRYHVRCVLGATTTQPKEPYTANGDGTVTDNRTGLIWQQSEAGAMTWEAAQQYVRRLSLAGHNDWRLPTIKELESLSNERIVRPSIPKTHFPGAEEEVYWSSTPMANRPAWAWTVDFEFGIASYEDKAEKVRVRAVRGGSLGAAQFTSQPSLAPNPNPAVPLAAIVRFTAAAPVETTITVSDGERKWDVKFDARHDPGAGLPVVGFYPGKKHELRVRIRDRSGKITQAAQVLEFTPPALPFDIAEFPPIQVKTSKPKSMEPGWTLLSMRRGRRGGGPGAGAAGVGARKGGGGPRTEPVFATGYGLVLALDEMGKVVWFYHGDHRVADVHRLRNGNIAFITNDNRLVEVDLLGNQKGEWCAARRPQGACTGVPVDALTMHHSFEELPNGNFLINSGELREIDNYYTSETDPKAPRKRQKVMGDQVVEFDRTGRVVWRWSAFDHLDLSRLGYLTVNEYWPMRGFPDTLDWTHGNGVFHDERDDSILFNSRQQSSVFKIERPSGRLVWIFGEPGGWSDKFQSLLFKPDGVSEWPWHHHAPRLSSRGTLAMFNNGIIKTRPFNPPAPDSEVVSGALEYSIDPASHTAKLIWSSDTKGQPDTVNTFAMGDVDFLPKTGNVLVIYGSAARTDTRLPWTRVREFRHTTPAEIVYDVVLADNSDNPPVGWVAFGGDRIAKLQ